MQPDSKAVTIELVPLKDIALNPKNSNKHSEEQIDRLIKIIKYQGFREPGVISTRSGYLIAGEGRYLALKKMGAESMPCSMQDFEDEDQEMAFGISTNAIASWAELDLSMVNAQLPDLSPEFNLDVLGIFGFTLDVSERNGIAKDSISQGDTIERFLNNDLRYLQLNYNQQDFDSVVSGLDRLCEKYGVENHSDAVKRMVLENN